MNFAKFLGTPFLTEHLRWLLLVIFRRNITQWTQYCILLLLVFKNIFVKSHPSLNVFLKVRVFENFEKIPKALCHLSGMSMGWLAFVSFLIVKSYFFLSSFHVGSGCFSATAFYDAVRVARRVFDIGVSIFCILSPGSFMVSITRDLIILKANLKGFFNFLVLERNLWRSWKSS